MKIILYFSVAWVSIIMCSWNLEMQEGNKELVFLHGQGLGE